MADTQSNIQVNIDTTQALASIKNLQRQISAFHSSMAKGGTAANAVSSQLQQTLINSINATGKFSAGIRTIRTTTESFTDSLEKNKFSLGEYFRYAGGASKTFGRLFKTEFETINKVARENVKDLQTQYISLGRDASGAMKSIAVRPLALDMTDLGTRTQIAAQKQAILNQLLKQGSTNLLNFGKNTQWAGRQLMVGFTLPLVALGSAASKTFMDMETQAIRFKKVYGDLFTPTAESQQALKDIQELGKEFTKYGIAVSTTVELAAEAAAAGFKGVDLQRQTAAATRLSILGQVESQKALETTISLQNAFSMSSENLAESIDFLNAVENQTVLSLDDVATAIPKAAPVIQQLGGDVKDLAFLMTAMKEGGINASEGANALKSGLASLINPTGKANAMLLSFGINAKKIVLDNKGDLKKTVVEFATALNMLDPLNRAQAIEQMFGKFQFARLSTLFANVTKEGTQASRVLDLAGASVQELATLAEKELGMTSESAMNKFKGAVENLKLSLIPLGEQFLKAVTPIAEFITKVLNKFEGLSENTKKIIVTITALVAGLGPVLLMTVGLVMNGIANMIKLFTFLKSSFNRTGQATAVLGTEVQYMTTEQRNAAAVAASLDQVHTKLQQTFTSEAAAVNALTRAYQRAIAAQSQFVPVAPPITRGPIKKFADGRPLTVGGTGNKDSELALLMPGETVIPTAMSKKYAPLINAMIAGNIPGYEFGKTFSFGGKDFDIPQGSIGSVQKLIADIQKLGGVIDNIDDVILQALERLASGVEGSTKITAKRLASALAPVTDLAKSTLAAQGKFSGNAGVVMAHGLPKVTLTPEQITAFEEAETGTTFGSSLKGRAPGPVTGLTNMVFPMPAGFNQDRMTGAEGAQWIGQNRTRFTSELAAQAGLDPNDPDLLRFGTAVGKALKSAAYRGVVVTQEDFEKIISEALEKEIFDVGKNTSAAVKTAFADAKKVSTLMYPQVSSTGRESYPRPAVPAALRGATVGGVELSGARSYRSRSTVGAEQMNIEADNFTMKSVRARVRRFFTRMPKEVEQEVKEVLDITSPSKVTKQLGSDTATGFVAGVKELNDDAKAAGEQIGSSLVDGTKQSARRRRVATRDQGPVVTQSGRARRVATRPQGPAPIGATPQPGMTILPIVPPDPNGPNPTGPTTTSQTRGQMLTDRARGVGGRLNTFGGGMGLLGVNMGLSMVPDFAGKGILQGGLAGANLGQMFGPYGMAIGATIGTVSSAVAALIGKYKELQAVTAATFKSSTDLATFFGNKVVDTTVKVGSLSSSILGVANASDTLAQSFGYTNEELSRFVSLIESLPEDNPLRTIVEGLKDEDNPDKVNEIAKAFIATQVALGQIKPDQAQKSLDLILAASGKVAMVGSSFINFQSQTQAIAISLRNATGNADGLGTSLIQLVGAASNSTSLIDMMAIIDGIALSGLSAAQAITAMRDAFLSVGNTQAAQSVTALERIPGIQKEQLAYLLATGTRGFREKITKDTKINDIMKRAEEFNKNYFKQLSGTNVTQTLAYKEAEAEAEGTKKQIDLLKQKKKIIDDQIKKQEKITNEIKRQNDYLDKQADLDKQIVEAKLRGDYIGAANLLQEKTQNTAELNAETEKSALQAKSDALQEQIDALQLRNDEIVDAINKSAQTAAAASDAAANKIVNGLKPGGFDYDQPQDEGNKRTDKVVPTEILDRVGGKTVAQTTTDPKTGEIKLLESGIFQTRLMRFKNAGRGLKPGDIVQVGPDGDIIAVQTDNPVKPKTSGSIQITHVDKDQGIAQFRVHYASGGMIRGAGTATSDSIPAYLSNGEYVVKAKSVKKYGTETLDALNAGKFATGGQVGRSPSSYIPRLKDGGNAKDGFMQRWSKSISGSSLAEMMGTAQLLRLISGQGKKGDKLGASMVPLNLLGSGFGSKIMGNLGKSAFYLPNKINQMINQRKVNSMVKSGVFHGSQPVGFRGEEYLQGTNILDGSMSTDPFHGMGFYGTTSRAEANLYASGYNSTNNWGESFGSMNQIVGAPRGKYVDFTRGPKSIKWQDYGLSKSIGKSMPENLGDLMNAQGLTGGIMNRISSGRTPADIMYAKWLAFSNSAGVMTKEIPGFHAGGPVGHRHGRNAPQTMSPYGPYVPSFPVPRLNAIGDMPELSTSVGSTAASWLQPQPPGQKLESTKDFLLKQLMEFRTPFPIFSSLGMLGNAIQKFESRENQLNRITPPDDLTTNPEGNWLASRTIRTNPDMVKTYYLDVRDDTYVSVADRKRNIQSIFAAAEELTKLSGVQFKVLMPGQRQAVMSQAYGSLERDPNKGPTNILPIRFVSPDVSKEMGIAAGTYSGSDTGIRLKRAAKNDWMASLTPWNREGSKQVAMHEILHHINEEYGVGDGWGDHAKNPLNIMFPYATTNPLNFVSNNNIEQIRGDAGYYDEEFIMPKAAGGLIKKYATGGMIRGFGTPTSDSIPAYLSNGEYVIKADSVKKYGVGTLDALNAGKFANGGLMQRFKNGIPAFGDGGPAWWKRIKTMGKFGFSGSLYKLMEDGERWLSLKHGANENSSGFHKWSKAIARTLYNVPQGAVAGLPFGLAGLIGGAIFGGVEGLEGLRRDGSQYGVKGGSRSTEKGFSAKKELDSMSFQQTGADMLKAFGTSAILGPLINLLPKGVQKAITTKLGQNVVSSALIGMAPFNPTMGFGTAVKPTTAITQKFGASKPGSAVEQRISGVAGSRTFAGSVNTIENQIPVTRTSDDVSKALVDDMFASAMSVANAAGRFAPNFLSRSMEAREGPAQFATYEEIDPLLDDVTKWPWVSSKPSESPVIDIPKIVDTLSLKQKRMIAYLAGKKSSLVGVPSVTQKELDSGYNWYYKQYGDEALDWDKFKAQKLASVGLSSPAHKKFTGYVTDTRAFETLHENDRMTPKPGDNPGTTSRKFSIGQARQSDEFDKIFGTNNVTRYETPLLDGSDYGVALRQKFDKVYDELIRRGYIRKAWYDAKGKRHEQKDTAPLPGSPFFIPSRDALHGSSTPSYRGKALTRYEFYKAIAASLPDGFTSSRRASQYSGGALNYLDRPNEFTSLINQIYAEQHGLTPGEKIKFWKYDLYGSPLKNEDGQPVAAGYYTLDKGMAYAYARARSSNVTQEELDMGSSRIFGASGPEQASTRGAYSIELYPHEIPQVLGLGGLKDEMGIVIGETLAKARGKFVGMAKADEYKYDVDPGAIRGLSPWKMYAPGDPWTVESPKSVFGVPIADSARMAYLLNTEQLSLRVGGKKDWSDASVSQVLKDAKPYISMDGTSRFVAQDAIPQNWGSDAEAILERMLKAQEMYNLIRVHIQNLPKVEFLKTLSKRVPGLATGGLIKGPGTGRSDSIRASLGYAGGGSIRVSNGEYVVKASSVRDYGVKTMDAINSGTAKVGTESGGTVYNINMPVTSNNANPEIVANEVMRKLKLEISKNNKTNRVGG